MACSIINNFYSPQNSSQDDSKKQEQYFQGNPFSNLEKVSTCQLRIQKSQSNNNQFLRDIPQSLNKTNKKTCLDSYKCFQHKDTFSSNNKNNTIKNNLIGDIQKIQQIFKAQQSLKQGDQYFQKFLKNKSKTEEYVNNNNSNYDNYESDVNSEDEEFSIWDETGLQNSGVNIDTFVDSRGTQLDFYQIYRLRSSLYQPQYISRIDTIKEVQTISSHFNQEISLNKLKLQQNYLDLHFDIQKKNDEGDQQLNKQQIETSYVGQNKKSIPERISRTQSQYVERFQISSKQQQDSKLKNLYKTNSSREKKLECLYIQSERNYKQKSQETFKQNDNKQQDDVSKKDQQIKKLILQNKSNQSRKKVRIIQQQTGKLIENKKIPIKQITLQDNSLFQDDLSTEISPRSNLIQNERKTEQQYQISELNQNQIDKKNEHISLIQNLRQQSVTNAASSVISYLKQIISNH